MSLDHSSLFITQCVMDLDKVNLVMGLGVKPIPVTAPAVSKNDARFKSGQMWLHDNHLAL